MYVEQVDHTCDKCTITAVHIAGNGETIKGRYNEGLKEAQRYAIFGTTAKEEFYTRDWRYF